VEDTHLEYSASSRVGYGVRPDGVAVIVLNRPEKLNAFDLPMYEEICRAFQRAEDDPVVRVIVIRGEGRAFCSGRDFTYSAELQEGEDASAWRRRYKLFSRWTIANSKPTIALVQGYALGGGGSLAVGCDITVAAEGTKFGYPETRHGIASKTMLWAWALGPKRAKEIVTTGRTLGAREGLSAGLVNHVVPGDELIEFGMALAGDIAALPFGVPEIMKRHCNYAYRDMLRVTFQDRIFDVDTAAWDAAGVEPSPWRLSADAARARILQGEVDQWEET
jgi:enoyl-CoA hydratase